MNKISFFLVFICQMHFSAHSAEKTQTYDTPRNVTKYTAPHAGEISYSYDPLNRLTGILYPDGKNVKYVYDYNNNLTEISDHHGITSYSYDALNRLIKTQLPENLSLSFEYDAANRLVKIIYPDQEEVKYVYDHRGRLILVSDQIGATRYEYDDATNLVIKEQLANGVVTEYAYDNYPRVINVSHKQSNGTLIISHQFTYDKNNNCTSTKETTCDKTNSTIYLYDALNRLVEVLYSDHRFEKYTYDGAGNRLTRITQDETVIYEYDAHNRLIRTGETYFHYDASGNLIKKTSKGHATLFGYDAIGRLLSFDDGKNKVLFSYDGQGRRISKTVNGKKTFFINDPIAPISRVLLEKNESGKTVQRYVYGCSRLFSQDPSNVQFFLYDQPGKSVSCLVDKQQKILEHFSYAAFGARNEKKHLDNSYGYAGEEYDEETSLIYLRNRYYDPEIGRFITPDSELGILEDPQTLNPYVYVRNNPINYIDPLGLYAVKVPLTFYGNYPLTKIPEGKSNIGHAWIGGIDIDGNAFTQGAWPHNIIHRDEHVRSLNKETVSLTIWVTPEQQRLARNAGNYERWTVYDNCVDHVTKSLDAIGYPHHSFKLPGLNVSAPTIYCDWIKRAKKRIDPRFDLAANDIIPYKHNKSLLLEDAPDRFEPNYGGISLSKTAELMTNLSDISGVIFDQKTEQLILYGKKDLTFPQMHLDDLAVAVRSIYGLGSKEPQDPGISMDPEPHSEKKKHPQMNVTYYGDTKDTQFGHVMFEADLLLKNLILGRDNLSGKKFKAHVDGYTDLLDLYNKRKHRHLPPFGNFTWRMWFVPEKISLIQSEDKTSMIFDQVRMQVLSESKFRENSNHDPVLEIFANHLTHNYDRYAQEFQVLQDLKRLGKITGIVKWIKEQEIPFDLSFFKSYTPQFVNTPVCTKQISDMEGGVCVSGGIVYHLDDHNFITTTDRAADEAKNEVLQYRSGENELTWDFGRGYGAVAQTFTKTLKVGNVRKTFVDMSFPGTLPITLVRTYDSFNDQTSGFGLGWDAAPANLRFPSQQKHLRFSDGTVLKIHTEIFVRLKGVESSYKVAGLNLEKRPIYQNEEKIASLHQTPDGTFLFSTNNELLLFNEEGCLLQVRKKNSTATLDYSYEKGKLLSISRQGEAIIHFEYEENRVSRALGKGNKTIGYSYTPEGQLKTVRDQEGILESYEYDRDLRLTAIFNAKGTKIFEASYDVYSRADEKQIGNIRFKQEFSLSERRARIEGENHYFLEQQFDERYRPQKIADSFGKQIEISYSGPFGPSTVIDNAGLKVFYEYDALGHLTKVKDAYRGERKFSFDPQGNLLEEIDGRGTQTIYGYDEQGRLVKKYCPFRYTHLSIKNGELTIWADEQFATTFHYNPETDSLCSIDFPGGGTESYQFDKNGLLLELCTSDGMISKRTYDERSRLTEISEANKTLRYSYDERDRITKISAPHGEVSYSYDENDNILAKTDLQGFKTHFEYDGTDRLVKVTDALQGVGYYEYNSFGNLTKITLPNGSIRELRYDEFQRPAGTR